MSTSNEEMKKIKDKTTQETPITHRRRMTGSYNDTPVQFSVPSVDDKQKVEDDKKNNVVKIVPVDASILSASSAASSSGNAPAAKAAPPKPPRVPKAK